MLFGQKIRICLNKHRYSTCTGSLLENYFEFLEMGLSARNSENYLEFLEIRLSPSYLFGQKKEATCTSTDILLVQAACLENYLEFLEMRLSTRNQKINWNF